MAKSTIIDSRQLVEKLTEFKSNMARIGASRPMLLGIGSCIEIIDLEPIRQHKLRKQKYQGMLNGMCKSYERILETTGTVNFGDFEAMILDHLVASNSFLAAQIEELENCSPEEFKKMALVLAKKEL